jgi:hypothetical protein
MENIKNYLEQYTSLKNLINSDYEELARLRSFSCKVSNFETVSGNSGFKDKIGDVVEKIIMLESKILEEIDMLLVIENEIKDLISNVKSLKLRYILQEHYINQKSFKQISEEKNYENAKYIYKLHEKALKNIQIIVDKCELIIYD